MKLNKSRVGSKMAHCKDPMKVLIKNIKSDDKILRALNNGSKKTKKSH
jgi:hypothetical protein